MGSRHLDVRCDACNQKGFQLRRYKCLRCFNYDLCGECFDNRRESRSHLKTHPMQCLLLQSDHEIFFQNDDTNLNSQSHTCPLCGALGFREAEFANHVFAEHPPGQSLAKFEVICPLCIGSDSISALKTQSLAHHLTSKHHLKKHTKEPLPNETGSACVDSAQALSVRTLQSNCGLAASTGSSRVRQSDNPLKNSFNYCFANSPTMTADEELAHLFSLHSSQIVLIDPQRSAIANGDGSTAIAVPPHSHEANSAVHTHGVSPQVNSSSVLTAPFSIASKSTIHSKKPVQDLPASPQAVTVAPCPSEMSPSVCGNSISTLEDGLPVSKASFDIQSLENEDKADLYSQSSANPQSNFNSEMVNFNAHPPSSEVPDYITSIVQSGLLDEVQEEASSRNAPTINLLAGMNHATSADSLPMEPHRELSETVNASASLQSVSSNVTKSVKKSSNDSEDLPACQKDSFDLDWSYFLHELIWESLNYRNISDPR